MKMTNTKIIYVTIGRNGKMTAIICNKESCIYQKNGYCEANVIHMNDAGYDGCYCDSFEELEEAQHAEIDMQY